MHILNLALQGGGSHGAFTWGVLDALLADGRIRFEGLSGTSAGALNAVALASGWAAAEAARRDAHEGARERLAAVWTRVSAWGSLGPMQQQFLRFLWGGLPPLSPYQSNPMDINPLRDLVEAEIDFDAIRRHAQLKVFVSATHVTTGKAVVFSGRQLDARAVLASACLPMLFQAVEIEGEAYWDGGYSVNPPLAPLISECQTADLMLVQINPVARKVAPRSAGDIADRVSEITFNASLLTQMRAIDFVNRLLAEGAISHERCKAVRVHRIDGGAALAAYPGSSRSSPDAAMIQQLCEAGRTAARDWMRQHHAALGRHGTVDIRRDYLDDTRMDLPLPAGSRLRSIGRGFRPWLARLLRQQRA
ncbi:MAG TPA: patatin-like phospholipase family protein [Ramlibacter sp.]|jgi:NTE family protein|nr:patatin-like phospholipase family protein [Ramlibacter sp.]